MGHYGCLSFFLSKNLGEIGDGGMVVTNDAAPTEMVRVLRAHGATPKYYHQIVIANFRLDAIQAAALRVKPRYPNGWTAGRQANAAWCRSGLAAVDGVAPLREARKRRHIYNELVITSRRRDKLRDVLKAASMGSEAYWPVPFHRQPCFSDIPLAQGILPAVVAAAEASLAVPVYPKLTGHLRQTLASTITMSFAQESA